MEADSCIIIHDSCEVMPTMGSLACGTCCTAIFSSAIAATLGKQEACFLMAEKSGTAWSQWFCCATLFQCTCVYLHPAVLHDHKQDKSQNRIQHCPGKLI